MSSVKKFIKWAKHKWGKKLFFFLMALMSLKTLMKTYGWLRKKNLQGKHVYITGAGMGIGRLMTLILAKQGCRITMSDINESAL